MKIFTILLFLLLSLPTYAEEVEQKIDLETFRTIIKEMRSPYMDYVSAQINGTCSFSIKPDAKRLMAGIVREGEDPIKLKKELKESISKVQSLSSKHKIKITTSDVVRSLKNQRSTTATRPSFVYLQKVTLELGEKIDIDQLLVDLIEIGVSQFGPHTGNYYSNNQNVAVVYQFVDYDRDWFEGKIKNCAIESINDWCKRARNEREKELCELSADELYEFATNIHANLNSQPVYQASNNYNNSINMHYPGGLSNLLKVSLADNVTLDMQGNLNISVYRKLN